MAKWLDNDGLLYVWSKIKSKFVAQEEGKGLSSNDYTDDEKSKLASLNNYTHPTYTAMIGRPTDDFDPPFGGSVMISQVSSDETGHITGMTDRTITFPSATASDSANGLMSSTDKTKLDGIEEGANKYTHPTYYVELVTGGPDDHRTPAFGETFEVPYVASDETGHVADLQTVRVTIPSTIATQEHYGLMSGTDKIKLDNIDSGANRYVHPTYTAITGQLTVKQRPEFGEDVTVSQVSSNYMGHVTEGTDITITIPSTLSNGSETAGLIKTSSTVTSSSGYTACPVISGVPYYKDTNTTYSEATTSAAGLMSATDKTKLDGIETGANAYTHPSYTALTGVPTADATPEFGETFSVSQVTSDSTGHVSGMTTRTITIPSATATTSASGLMSSTDKTKLDGLNASDYLPITGGTIEGKSYYPLSIRSNNATHSYIDFQNSESSSLGKIGFTNEKPYVTVEGANYAIIHSGNYNTYANNYHNDNGYNHIPSGGESGQILRWSADGTAEWGDEGDTTYSTATSSTLGLVKIGYTESGQNYPVELNSSGQMFVNVPWTDTNTDTDTGATSVEVTGSGNAITTASYDASTRTITLTKGATYNNYSLPTASSSTLGGVKTTSTVTSTSGLTACPIISGVPYYKDTNTTYSTATTSANGLMSSSDKSKLDALPTNATLASTYATKSEIVGMYKYKGSVTNASSLPTDASTGDVYNIENASTYGGAGANVAWNGEAWDSLGEIFSIEAITNAEIDTICV